MKGLGTGIVLLALLAAGGCSSSSAPGAASPTPTPTSSLAAASLAVSGKLTLGGVSLEVQGSPCHEHGRGFDDIKTGADVVISDDAGHTLAITHLGPGHVGAVDFRCEFKFTTHVPAGKRFYGIEVTHRGVVKFPESELGHVALTLK